MRKRARARAHARNRTTVLLAERSLTTNGRPNIRLWLALTQQVPRQVGRRCDATALVSFELRGSKTRSGTCWLARFAVVSAAAEARDKR